LHQLPPHHHHFVHYVSFFNLKELLKDLVIICNLSDGKKLRLGYCRWAGFSNDKYAIASPTLPKAVLELFAPDKIFQDGKLWGSPATYFPKSKNTTCLMHLKP
jgi:hypothetical protein